MESIRHKTPCHKTPCCKSIAMDLATKKLATCLDMEIPSQKVATQIFVFIDL